MRTFLAAQQVTRQFWPERVQVMDAFPTTPSGKVQKFELRQILAASEMTEALLHSATAASAR
jgi:non-ribosomal peptide synthetase component E (peptide arylation enzyme)